MHLTSVQVACATLVTLALSASGASLAEAPHVHHIARRSFFNLQCKGVYDAAKFSRLDRLCEDCYMLFREPQLYALCRKDCFISDYFRGCVEVLQETEDLELFGSYIKQLHGTDPESLPELVEEAYFTAKCFTTAYFKGCMESLYLYDEEEQIDQMIDYVGRK